MSALATAEFDPNDKNCWYFGPMTREEANTLLDKDGAIGVFLVRDSSTIRGDFVLCVKEQVRNSHYIINKILVSGMARFRIGDQEFNDLPSLLQFYKTHYLDTTPLIRPVGLEFRDKYVGKYDFKGRDPEDLPFEKGQVLVILRRDEEQWWTARNDSGQCGQVPVPYLEKYDPSVHTTLPPATGGGQDSESQPQRRLPAKARVIRARVPSVYDRTALTLEVGEIILVTAMHINGTWEGRSMFGDKKGSFPFNFVQFIDTDANGEEADEQDAS